MFDNNNVASIRRKRQKEILLLIIMEALKTSPIVNKLRGHCEADVVRIQSPSASRYRSD